MRHDFKDNFFRICSTSEVGMKIGADFTEKKRMPKQEPIAIGALWFRTNHTGTRIDVLIEVDGLWKHIAELPGTGQGVGSHIIEPTGMREAIKEEKPIKVHV